MEHNMMLSPLPTLDWIYTEMMKTKGWMIPLILRGLRERTVFAASIQIAFETNTMQ